MKTPPITTGLFLDELPYVATGSGPDPLIIFPHIRETFEDIREAHWCRRWLRRFSKNNHSVYIIGRSLKMPRNFTTESMAADYARVVRNCLGPATIMGFSLGGLVAQHFAAANPDLTNSLVLGVAGVQIGSGRLPQLRQWITLARQGDWQQIYLHITSLMHTGMTEDKYEWALPLLQSSIHHKPRWPQRFIASVQASIEHDGTSALAAITTPALVIGGTCDTLFPGDILRHTASLVPGARLVLLEGAGHGAFDEHKRAFDKEVLNFLKACEANT